MVKVQDFVRLGGAKPVLESECFLDRPELLKHRSEQQLPRILPKARLEKGIVLKINKPPS